MALCQLGERTVVATATHADTNRAETEQHQSPGARLRNSGADAAQDAGAAGDGGAAERTDARTRQGRIVGSVELRLAAINRADVEGDVDGIVARTGNNVEEAAI